MIWDEKFFMIISQAASFAAVYLPFNAFCPRVELRFWDRIKNGGGGSDGERSDGPGLPFFFLQRLCVDLSLRDDGCAAVNEQKWCAGDRNCIPVLYFLDLDPFPVHFGAMR